MAAQPTPAHPATMLAEVESSSQSLDSPLPAPLFKTKRLLARPMHPQDAASSQRACAPASITKYMSLAFAHPYTLDHAHTWIRMNRDTPHNNLFLTTHDDAHTVIGGIGLKPGADIQAHTGEVGYWLAEEHQGKGLMREALAGFVEWTFERRRGDGRVEGANPPETRKTRLFAGVLAANTASMRILEGCGFTKEGVQKGQIVTRYGEVTDLHLYGLRVEDWEGWRRGRGSKGGKVEG